MRPVIRRIVLLLFLFLPQLFFPLKFKFESRVFVMGNPSAVLKNGHAESVRLNGIDCPEKGQDLGARAKQLTSDLCFGF